MRANNLNQTTDRREFLGTVAGGAAALSLGSLFAPFSAMAEKDFKKQVEDADAWFAKVKGKHRIVFDTTSPDHGVFPFAWPKVFLMTNAATGSPEKDCTAVVILRHEAIPFAMQDSLWAKYKFADMFKIKELGPAFRAADAATAMATRNPFWNTKPDDFMMPVFGALPIGIKDLQASGVMFCVCNAALTVYSGVVAMQTNGNADEIKKEWTDGLIPGIQVVPSGVWAVGRAQEHGCAYCFVG
jgi:intracellular sulfur oxidation DsrE/DsrF family protein